VLPLLYLFVRKVLAIPVLVPPRFSEYQAEDLNSNHPLAPVTIFYAGNGASIEQAALYSGGKKVCGASVLNSPTLLYHVFDETPHCDPIEIERDPDRVPLVWKYSVLQMKIGRYWRGMEEARDYRAPYLNFGRANLAQADDVCANPSSVAIPSTSSSTTIENR